MSQYPIIGINPKDPYGAIMAAMFTNAGLDYQTNIKARFGTTVCSLVAAGLGIAIIDEFTVAYDVVKGVKSIPIEAPSSFRTFIAYRNDIPLSVYAEYFVQTLRKEMNAVSPPLT